MLLVLAGILLILPGKLNTPQWRRDHLMANYHVSLSFLSIQKKNGLLENPLPLKH